MQRVIILAEFQVVLCRPVVVGVVTITGVTSSAGTSAAGSSKVISAPPCQIGLHIPQVQAVLACPVVDDAGNLMEALGVAAALLCFQATRDKHEAMHHFVEKGGDEQASVVLGVAENGGRQYDQRFPAAETGTSSEGRRADNVVLVLLRCGVAPVPSDATCESRGKEELVGGREDAAKGVVVEGKVGASGFGVDEGAENALWLRVRVAPAVESNVIADEAGGLDIFEKRGV